MISALASGLGSYYSGTAALATWHYPLPEAAVPSFRVFSALVFGLLALAVAYSWLSPVVTAPNERSRLYLTISLLESGTIEVNDVVERHGRPIDIAYREGRYYTDKAPGSSVLALPALAVYRAAGGDMDSIEEITLFARRAVMLPFALGIMVLFFLLSARLGLPREVALAFVTVLILGTSLFHYAGAFYGHAIVAFLALCCAHGLMELPRSAGRRQIIVASLTGLCAGLAFAVEYQAVVLAAALFVAALSLSEARRIPALAGLAIGAAIPALVVLAYHQVAFGSPFTTSYGFLIHQPAVEAHAKGLFGITAPSISGTFGLLFSAHRGLIFCAPLVLLGVFGLPTLWRRAHHMALFVGASMLGFFVIASGAHDVWFAGWSFGPRLLIPFFGLAGLSGALYFWELRERSSRLVPLLGGWLVASMIYNPVVFTAFPELPPHFTAPLTSVALPLHAAGASSPNLGMLWSGVPGGGLIPLGILVGFLSLSALLLLVPPCPIHRWKGTALTLIAALAYAAIVLGVPETATEASAERFIQSATSMNRGAP